MATRRQAFIGNEMVWIDSLLEERMLNWLEANGYSGRWRRPDVGLNAGIRNYTPDVELLIQFEGKTHLAIVEIKPVLRGKFGFSKYIFERMRIAASVYFSKILLLYVDETQTWYRIDNKTGELIVFGPPVPARKTIDEAYKPRTLKARSVGSHRYKKRLDQHIMNKLADALQASVQALFGPKKPTRRKRNYKHRK